LPVRTLGVTSLDATANASGLTALQAAWSSPGRRHRAAGSSLSIAVTGLLLAKYPVSWRRACFRTAHGRETGRATESPPALSLDATDGMRGASQGVEIASGHVDTHRSRRNDVIQSRRVSSRARVCWDASAARER